MSFPSVFHLLTLLFLTCNAALYHGSGRSTFTNLYYNNCTARSTKCQELNSNSSCLGVPLKYSYTNLAMTDLDSIEKANETLQTYEPLLKYIPVCWEVIQPFLCALYFPKCGKDENKYFSVEVPSREMCNLAMNHCRPILFSTGFLGFVNCTDFPVSVNESASEQIVCKNYFVEEKKKFNITSFCMDPLIKTDKPDDWINGTFIGRIEGCGLKCKDSLYTENEQHQIHKLITYCALVSIVINLFTVVTFVIDWRSANKYPTKALFYVNICFVISNGGWLVQFLGSETRDDVVCKKDGTLRKFEPSATENLSCVVVFFMIYYFLIAALVWFMVFSYAWYMSTLQALGKVTERVDKKHAYFHLFAWSLPLVLTITTMAIGEIDGDYVTGICFVGFVNTGARASLMLIPLLASMIISCYIIVRGLILLIKVKIDAREVMSVHANRKIQDNIVKMGMVMILMMVFCAVTVTYHIYYARNKDIWYLSLENYILCKLTTFGDDYSRCKQTRRPSVAMLQLELLAVFGKGIAMASCFWCEANYLSWRRYIARKFHGNQDEDHIKIAKSKVIANLWEKREKFKEGGQIPISQVYTDPVGLKFEINDAEASLINTSFIRGLPRLINRRDALPNDMLYQSSQSSHHNQSYDSEINLNVRQVSIESRRNSQDSQLSVQIAELKATRKINSRRHNRKYNNHRRHYHRSSSRNMGTSRHGSLSCRGGSKHGSNTSLDSQLQMLTFTNCTSQNRFAGPNLGRRTANAGLDEAQISDLLNNGKLMLPSGFRSTSEDENMSVTISESTFSMRKNNQNLDFNDQFDVRQLTHGLCLSNMSTSESEREEKYPCKSGRDSHSSKRSKKSKKSSRKAYSSASCDEKKHQHHCESSSCEEIQQLVQSSLNSNCSVVGVEKNRGSRQSKNSTDVAVQANAYDLDLEMQTKNDNDKPKTKQAKTLENKNYKRQSKYHDENKISSEKIKKSKEKYKNEGSYDEKKCLKRSLIKNCSDSDEEILIEKNKICVLQKS